MMDIICEKVRYIYKKNDQMLSVWGIFTVLLKENVNICGTISINQAGKLTLKTTSPKLVFQILLAPGKQETVGC